MKRINEVFEDSEHEEITKNKSDMNWHDFLLMLARNYNKLCEVQR